MRLDGEEQIEHNGDQVWTQQLKDQLPESSGKESKLQSTTADNSNLYIKGN